VGTFTAGMFPGRPTPPSVARQLLSRDGGAEPLSHRSTRIARLLSPLGCKRTEPRRRGHLRWRCWRSPSASLNQDSSIAIPFAATRTHPPERTEGSAHLRCSAPSSGLLLEASPLHSHSLPCWQTFDGRNVDRRRGRRRIPVEARARSRVTQAPIAALLSYFREAKRVPADVPKAAPNARESGQTRPTGERGGVRESGRRCAGWGVPQPKSDRDQEKRLWMASMTWP